MIANTAFGWAAREVVMNTVASKRLDVSITHSNRKVNGQFTLGHLEYGSDIGFQSHQASHRMKLLLRHCKRIKSLFHG
jgi:hypothetical protein